MELPLTLRIVGKRALLMNNPASMAGGSTEPTRKKIPTPEEEAAAKVYRLPSGQLYIKTEAFAGSVRKAATGFKIGKHAAKPIFAAAITYEEEFCPLVDPETGKPLTEYAIYTCRAVVQRQGVLRSRPRLERWACSLKMTYDDELLKPEMILDMFQQAGRRVGVGDQRPGAPLTPGSFGTYTVEIETQTKAAAKKGRRK
jgi:hypothetical protein